LFSPEENYYRRTKTITKLFVSYNMTKCEKEKKEKIKKYGVNQSTKIYFVPSSFCWSPANCAIDKLCRTHFTKNVVTRQQVLYGVGQADFTNHLTKGNTKSLI